MGGMPIHRLFKITIGYVGSHVDPKDPTMILESRMGEDHGKMHRLCH